MGRIRMTALQHLVLASCLISGCATVPDPGNDPNTGGFLGGLTGVMRGDYNARSEERKQSLDRLRGGQAIQEQERSALEATKEEKAEMLAEERQRLAALEGNVKKLSAAIESANRSAQISAAKAKELRDTQAGLEKKAREIRDRLDRQIIDSEQAEAERKRLEQEYKALADLLSTQ